MPNTNDNRATIRFEPETEAAIREAIDVVLRDHGITMAAPADTLFALVSDVATRAATAGYDRGVDRYIGPVDSDHPASLGNLDLRAIAAECLGNIDNECDPTDEHTIDSPHNIDQLAGIFARLMNVRVGTIAHMLGEEHDRLAKVADAYPTMVDAVCTQCAVIRMCVKMIEGGMLPASMVGDVATDGTVSP